MIASRFFTLVSPSNKCIQRCQNLRSIGNQRIERQYFTSIKNEAGHSHFANIKHKKDKNDKKKASDFSKISKQLMTAVKMGGTDPETNHALAAVLLKAKHHNFPKENIEHITSKTVDKNSPAFEHSVYEGHGPNGVSIIIEGLTDNKSRTSNSLKHIFHSNGGELGATGAVGWVFERKGMIGFETEMKEEEVLEVVSKALIDDIQFHHDTEKNILHVELICPKNDLAVVKKEMEDKGFSCTLAHLVYIPTSFNSDFVDEEQLSQFKNLLDELENNEDVQEVFHNYHGNLD